MPILKCPFRMLNSHNRNTVGFSACQTNEFSENITASKIHIEGVAVENFSITRDTEHLYILSATSNEFNDAAIPEFLSHLEVSITAFLGTQARNPFYGTPYIEFDRFNLELLADKTSKPSGAISISDKVAISISGKVDMSGIEPFLFPLESVAPLKHNSILQLYSDGLRVNSPQSKFFSWFIILEEFLEKSDRLNKKFTLLFNDDEITAINNFGDTFNDERKKGNLSSVQNRTLDSRHEKLAAILCDLGIKNIKCQNSQISITAKLCKKLIDERNGLFHRGKDIDEGSLYNVLFPIVTIIAGRSEEILSYR